MRFFIAIAIGAAAGMLYGWVINPVEYVDTAPASLRFDYKTDYILMTAEAYRVENDIELAVRRLALLGGESPSETVNQAILLASSELAYPPNDLVQMQTLAQALLAWEASQEMPLP